MADVVPYVIPTRVKRFSEKSVEVGHKRETGTGRNRARNMKEQDEKNDGRSSCRGPVCVYDAEIDK